MELCYLCGESKGADQLLGTAPLFSPMQKKNMFSQDVALIKHAALHNYMSLVLRKPVFRVTDQVRHKPACTATEDS